MTTSASKDGGGQRMAGLEQGCGSKVGYICHYALEVVMFHDGWVRRVFVIIFVRFSTN
jgi:hypothetical protein